MAKRKNYWLIIGLLGIVALLIAAVMVKNKNRNLGEKVIVEQTALRTIKETVTASGKIFPREEVKISSDVSGEVVELYVSEGDSVAKGQLLAKIDPDAYLSQVERGVASVNTSKAQEANAKAQIENAKAQKEQIVAQIANAREIHRRNDALKKEGRISTADFEASLANVQGLEANLRAAEASIRAAEENAKGARFSVASADASLSELRTNLRRTTIYAPMSGIISRLPVLKGERVLGTIQMQGTEIMRIADLNDMEVRVEVSENDIPRVKIGDLADVTVDAYIGRKFKGRVTQIANSSTAAATATSLATDQVTNFEIRVSIDPQSYADLVAQGQRYPFRPGMSATVSVNTRTVGDALSVPIQAVTVREREETKQKQDAKITGKEVEKTDDDFLEVVFVAAGDTVRMVEVRTGIQDATHIQVLSGLNPEDEVVAGPYTAISRKLKQGMKIQRVTEEELFSK